MNKEKDPKYVFTIEQIVSFATESVLRDGNHMPTLIVEGSHSGARMGLDEFGNTFAEHQKQLAEIGYFLAQDGKIGQLRQAFFISEGWMSISPGDKPPTIPPAQDPNRKEVLTISGLTVENRKASMVVFEMIRDSKGQLRELKAFETLPDASVSVQNPLLEALVLGYAIGLSPKF